MKTVPITLFSIALLSSWSAFAEDPAAPATPAPATAPATPGASGTTAPPADAKAERVRPLPAGDRKYIAEACGALQFQLKLAGNGVSRPHQNDAVKKMCGGFDGQIRAQWKWIVDLAQTRKMDGKDIPQEASKNDLAKLNRLDKLKEEKLVAEYLEIFAKESKKNAVTIEAASKTVRDDDLKLLIGPVNEMMKKQTEQLEAAYKVAKEEAKVAARVKKDDKDEKKP